mmetsp:Transcript_60105/g.173332  ORF Transcript_60105/g.173332 Transcript_60105/m.173332 type:complete len:238 (+) Transcript_60105:62-775(+)
MDRRSQSAGDLSRGRSSGIQCPGDKQPDYSAALARLQRACTRTAYAEEVCGIFGPQVGKPAHRPVAMRPPASGAGEPAGADSSRWHTHYKRTFVDHGPAAKPARTTKSDDDAEKMRRLQRSRQALASRNEALQRSLDDYKQSQEMIRSGKVEPAVGVFKSPPLEPPKPTIHANFVFSLPSSTWKSELRSSFSADAFSKSVNMRYEQPTKLSIVGKLNRFPLGGSLMSVGEYHERFDD